MLEVTTSVLIVISLFIKNRSFKESVYSISIRIDFISSRPLILLFIGQTSIIVLFVCIDVGQCKCGGCVDGYCVHDLVEDVAVDVACQIFAVAVKGCC